MYHLRQITYNNIEIMKTNLKLWLCLAFSVTLFSLQAKTIYYVKTDGAGNGSSWANAANNIQTMIDKAVSGDEVWVAQGTYYPTTETIARDTRSRSFVSKYGVNLYGGFSGSESAISQRALTDLNLDGKIDSYEFVNMTILSGDVDGVTDLWSKTTNSNGIWNWKVIGNESNCYRVITCSGNNIVNGFLITSGNANLSSDASGGGVCAYNSVIKNCIVSNCSANNDGGGILAFCTSIVTNCKISNCVAGGNGGGIYSSHSYSNYVSYVNKDSVINCTVENCSAVYNGGGISACDVTKSIVTNCSASVNGGGISSVYSCSNGSCSYIGSVNCSTVTNCSANGNGGGIISYALTNCAVSNCFAVSNGGGMYVVYTTTNCTVSNCSANNDGGGIYSPNTINCAVANCSAGSKGGGLYAVNMVTSCATSNNNTKGIIGNGIDGIATLSNCISPNITVTYVQPTSFIGIAKTDAQKSELSTANWSLQAGSNCINVGTKLYSNNSFLLAKDVANNLRVMYGNIDVGAYEYIVPIVQLPTTETFNNILDFSNSNLFLKYININSLTANKWTIINQKVDFTWQTNLTSGYYSQPLFTYQIDGTKATKVYLRYDMYFQAYAGTISPLGTEKLNVEFSTDLVTWSTIATYSNANGTIANQIYKHDISTLAAGKTFFIRFNANGANTNRIEKWEIDNVIIDTDGLSAVNTPVVDKYKYNILNGIVQIRELTPNSLIKLYDTTGKIILNKNVETESSTFSLPHKGIYIISINSDKLTENKKIIW